MNFAKTLLCFFVCIALSGCAGSGLNPHKPKLKSTLAIAKAEGTFRILSIKGSNPNVDALLDRETMKCGTTTFNMPRGNTVRSFLREIFEQELSTAEKMSMNGEAIEVVIKELEPESSKLEKGTWTLNFDYNEGSKTTNISSVTEFESKLSALAACVNTSNMFEEAVVDNFVEFFKRKYR